MRSLIGDLGETDEADRVLAGTFDRLDVHPAFLELLPFLRQPTAEEALEIFNEDDFRKGWGKMNQFTGCHGPLHFAHFQALSSDVELCGLATSFLWLGFTSGIPAARWLTGTDIMIEKQPGEYRVEKLRTILLMQPDFNFGNKLVGRAMMEQAERLHLLPEAQYGSRKNKSASTQVANKVLLFELCRLQRIQLGYCSTDAKSNYDRIIHSFAVLAMRRLGVPREVALCMFRVLQQMIHHVRSGFGTSIESYSSDSHDPFQGVGQGNGAGPAIWAAVSAPLFEYMNSRQRGVNVVSPLGYQSNHVSCLAFVDDTDLVFSPRIAGLPSDIVEGTQEELQAWERILKVTGGAIVPDKSFYWALDFVQDKVQVKGSLPPLKVTDSMGNEGLVPHIPASESRRTLGLSINPCGAWKAQKDKWRLLMEQWAESVKVAGLSRQYAMVELKARVLPRILYGLEATSLSRADCRYIMAPLVTVGLQSVGITKNLPRPIVFGPEEMLGLGLTDMYVAQGVRHLQLLELHGPSNTGLTGQLLRALLEESLIQVGLPGSIFTQNYDQYGALLPQGWIKTLWLFCWEYEIELYDWLPSFKLLRHNDRFLIHLARAVILERDNSSLISFNKCRRYLKVISLADIVTGDGTCIRKDAFEGARNKFCERPWKFTEAFPSAADWKVWRVVLRKIMQPGFSMQLSPSKRLGRWFSLSEWRCFTSGFEEDVFIQDSLGSRKHPLTSGSSRRRRYAIAGVTVDELPTDAWQRVVLVQSMNDLLSCGAMGSEDEPLEDRSNLPEIYTEKFGSASLAPENGGLIICSDGSFKNGHGTASWIAVAGSQQLDRTFFHFFSIGILSVGLVLCWKR